MIYLFYKRIVEIVYTFCYKSICIYKCMYSIYILYIFMNLFFDKILKIIKKSLLFSYRLCPSQQDSRLSLCASEAERKHVASTLVLSFASPHPEGTRPHPDFGTLRLYVLLFDFENLRILSKILRRIFRRCPLA